MMTMYTGSDNATRFCWIEDNDRDQCAMVDWDISEEEAENLAKSFKENGAPAGLEWQDGIFTIRHSVNGFSELAWHA